MTDYERARQTRREGRCGDLLRVLCRRLGEAAGHTRASSHDECEPGLNRSSWAQERLKKHARCIAGGPVSNGGMQQATSFAERGAATAASAPPWIKGTYDQPVLMAVPFVQDKNIPFITSTSRKPITVTLCCLIRASRSAKCKPECTSERIVPIYGTAAAKARETISFSLAKQKWKRTASLRYGRLLRNWYLTLSITRNSAEQIIFRDSEVTPGHTFSFAVYRISFSDITYDLKIIDSVHSSSFDT